MLAGPLPMFLFRLPVVTAMLVVVDENIPQWQLFAQQAQVRRLPGRSISSADVRQADALIVRSVTRVDASLLAGSKVRFVGTCTIGTDHLDLQYLQQQQIGWSNAPGCNAQAVVEYVLACLQVLAQSSRRPLEQLCYGIVGVGHVGGRLAGLLRALGYRVLLCDPPRQQREPDGGFVSLQAVLDNCDVISLHTPLQQDGPWPSHHLLAERELLALRRDAWLINAARGAVIDNKALRSVLQQRADVQVVLDVWEGEPDFDVALARLCRLATPHIAGYSLDGKIRGSEMIAREFARFFALSCDLQAEYPPAPLQEIGFLSRSTLAGQLAALSCLLYNPLHDDLEFRRLYALADEPRQAGFDLLRKNYRVRRELSTLGQVRGLAPGLQEFARALSLAGA